MKTTVGLTVVVVLLVTGCATTQRVAVKEHPGICAFLGEVCNELQPGARGEAGLRWVNPKSDPTQYTKVILEVVGFFGTDVSKVSPADQERLTALFQQSLMDALATKYQVVDQPAPGTATFQATFLSELHSPGKWLLTLVAAPSGPRNCAHSSAATKARDTTRRTTTPNACNRMTNPFVKTRAWLDFQSAPHFL